MKFLDFLRHTKYLSEPLKFAIYPPFLFMGAQITEVSSDYRHLRVKLPLRWYARNHHGTMFGGFMSAVADPLPALLCHKIFPQTEVWTKKLSLHFLRPGKTDLEIRIDISDEEVACIAHDLETKGESRPHFKFYYYDNKGSKVALVENTVAMKLSRKRGTRHRKQTVSPTAEALLK